MPKKSDVTIKEGEYRKENEVILLIPQDAVPVPVDEISVKEIMREMQNIQDTLDQVDAMTARKTKLEAILADHDTDIKNAVTAN